MYTGAGPTESDLPSGNLRFCTSDDVNPGNNYPIPIPSASYNYSYCRSIAFYVSVAPDTSITGIYLYTDGTLGWGADIITYIGNQTPATYIQATGTPGTTGTEMTAFYTGISSKSDFFGYNSGSPYGPITQIATSGTGRYTNYVVLQVRVGTTATSGAKTPETGTWKYNEV
jgi:hypothetical protein